MAEKTVFSSSRAGNYSQLDSSGRCLRPPARQQCPTSPVQTCTWNYGNLTHEQAEQLLMRPGLKPGTFLIRKSTTYQGSFALSVRGCDGKVFHYLINADRGGGLYVGFCGERKKVFNTMQELVFYYKTNGSLCCKLTDACPNAACKRSVTEIDRSSLVLLERIYGSDMDDMWYGTWACRVKKIPVQIRRLSPRLHSIADIVQETSVTRKLLHENVVQLFGVSTDKEPMYIISESLDNGSLLYYLREGAGQCITFREKIELAVQVARGIEYLHSQPCVHRFLCGKNIFLNDRNVPKIANFRYAKFLSGESSVLKLPVEDLHTRWSPPEVLESGLFSLKSDIWSFGILVTEIITNGRLPYSDVQCRAQLKRMVVSEHYRIPRARLIDCPVSLYEVLLSCWKSEPTKRPGFDFIITGLQDCIPLDKGCKSTLH